MSPVADAIADLLLADPVIGEIAGPRVYSRDLRSGGSQATPLAFDVDGMVQPSLVLGDGGGVREAFGSPVVADTLFLYGFCPDDTQGAQELTTLMTRAHGLLHRWRDGPTGAQLFFAFRLGQTRTDSTEGAIMDRLSFKVAGIPAMTL